MPAFSKAVCGLIAAVGFSLTVAGSAAASDPLVSVEWLKAHSADTNLVVLDIRSAIDGGGAKAYAEAHIPGSVHSDYDKGGWRVTRNNVPFMVPTTAELEKLIGELGIDETTHVVVAPAGVSSLDFGAAARTYWTLKYAGANEVSIVDGGITAWKAAGYPTESGIRAPTPAIFTAKVNRSILIEAPRSRHSSKNAARILWTPGLPHSSSARKRRLPRKPMAACLARRISTARSFTIV